MSTDRDSLAAPVTRQPVMNPSSTRERMASDASLERILSMCKRAPLRCFGVTRPRQVLSLDLPDLRIRTDLF